MSETLSMKLEYIINAIYSSAILINKSFIIEKEQINENKLSIEQISNIVVLLIIFIGYFFKFLIVFFYFIIYRGLRKLGIFIYNLFRAKCCLNCKKICNESFKDFGRTMKKLFTYNFFLYSNFFYGLFISIIFLLFVLTHCIFPFRYIYVKQQLKLTYLLFSYESDLLFEMTCITFFIIINPFFHVLTSALLFLVINITIFCSCLLDKNTAVVLVCFFIHLVYLSLIALILKTLYQFDYNSKCSEMILMV